MMIAKRLKALREITGVTKKEMAGALGLNVEKYQEYEAGKQDFTFSFLYTAANKMGVDIVELITGDTPKLQICSVVKKGEGLKMERRREYKYEHLAYIFKNKKMEPFLVTVEPRDTNAKEHMNSHEGQEFEFIVEGSMTLYIGAGKFILNEGDAVYFDAKQPHAMKANGGTCRFIAVIAK